MKAYSQIVMFAFLTLTFLSACQNKATEVKGAESVSEETTGIQEKDALAEADLKSVEVEISGMTCEIGCARLIQSKLYKNSAVSYAQVSFEDSLGVVTYDANRLSKEQLTEIIEKTGGGDLYRVKGIETTDLITEGP